MARVGRRMAPEAYAREKPSLQQCSVAGTAVMPHADGMPSPISDLLLVLSAFLAGGLMKGVTGLGLPTVAIGLLSLVMPPATAAFILIVPSLVTNVWQLALGPALRRLLGRLWPMQAGICFGAWAASGLLTSMAPGVASAALGAALIIYATIGLSPVRLPNVPARAEWCLGPAAGFMTGVITAATGVFVLPMVPYLQALGLKRDELVQALGISFTVATLALASSLAQSTTFNAGLLGVSVLAIAPALAGMVAGQHIRHAIQPDVFRRWFFVALLLLGFHLFTRALV
jgi:uncharacterized protein